MKKEHTSQKKYSSKNVAYILLRLTVGINLLCHGLVRFPKINGFREWMVNEFQQTILPSQLVYAWASVLPFLEFTVGLCIVLGLFTYRASIAGALIIIMLILGSCLHEQWEWAGMQMVYGLLFFFLIRDSHNNTLSLDNFIHRLKP